MNTLNIVSLLSRELATKPPGPVYLSGSDDISSLALILGQYCESHFGDKPQLVIVPSESDCHSLKEQLTSFFPQIKTRCLLEFDVSPYSNLYPKPNILAERVGWCFSARNQLDQIYIATAAGILQKTISTQNINTFNFRVSKNEELPDDFFNELSELGYTNTPVVEEVGQLSFRGGIVDFFSPVYSYPIRMELFGNTVDSIRLYDPLTQRSLQEIDSCYITPAREVILLETDRSLVAQKYLALTSGFNNGEQKQVSREIARGHYFHGIDFLLPYFDPDSTSPFQHFQQDPQTWFFRPLDIARAMDDFKNQQKTELRQKEELLFPLEADNYYMAWDKFFEEKKKGAVLYEKIRLQDSADNSSSALENGSSSLTEFKRKAASLLRVQDEYKGYIKQKLSEWRDGNKRVFLFYRTENSKKRLQALLSDLEISFAEPGEKSPFSIEAEIGEISHSVNLIANFLNNSIRFQDEELLFLKDTDILGSQKAQSKRSSTGTLEERAGVLSFGDLKVDDLVVHSLHGVGVYKGLQLMSVMGVDSEFIEIEYKDKDKLFLPIYRIGQLHKFSGPSVSRAIDKLGGNSWEKSKTKVKKHIRDIADKLLKLYAQRQSAHKEPCPPNDSEFLAFENEFPYEETEDQLTAIDSVTTDMSSDKPMDRLICGDVGFGKTEIAMRAAFKAVQAGRQVAVIAPTTVLTFQHTENFKKRFKNWPITIRCLNRFISTAEAKQTLAELVSGKVDILIGTHRLLSKDVKFKNLGLLVVDEEQKFGVRHKERIRELRVNVDTLAMSATPIPRTLNMSLLGIRGLSIINTPPVDRLPTRTFICKFEKETISKAIRSEISRGGQVFFLHNRVQSIYSLADELREMVPEIRIGIGHGQMEEKDLEKTILKFFNHEIDMLICTTIIESGMDIPKANTMFIDKAHQLGLSQLYQLRGRVGRSKDRAYCYLLVPRGQVLEKEAQERLRVIQENSALGSGFKIAQYDLELRGAGDILGENQSGHINAVGYELFLELLNETIEESKGETGTKKALEPEINLRIPSFIPDVYIPDIRVRLAYYKTLSNIQNETDLDDLEEELRDQFGKPPEQVINLLGIMYIRKLCRDLGVKDISSGKNLLSLAFTESTPLPPQKVIELTMRENKKYSLSPENKLKIRMNTLDWPRVSDELQFLLRLC